MAKYDLKSSYKAQLATDYLQKLIAKGAWVEVREMKMPRSIDSNRLYWVWLACIAKETGRDSNELHFLYRAMFLPKERDYIVRIIHADLYDKVMNCVTEFRYFAGMDLVIDIISESTTDQDSAQFSGYLDNIKKHARVNFDVILLSMEEKNFEDFYREYGFR